MEASMILLFFVLSIMNTTKCMAVGVKPDNTEQTEAVLQSMGEQIDNESMKQSSSKKTAEKIELCRAEIHKAFTLFEEIKQNKNERKTKQQGKEENVLLKEFELKVQTAQGILNDIKNKNKNENSNTNDQIFLFSDDKIGSIDKFSGLKQIADRKPVNRNKNKIEVIVFEQQLSKSAPGTGYTLTIFGQEMQ